MKKLWIIRIVVLLALGLLFYLFPLFHLESLSERIEDQQLASLNSSRIVANVWDTDLVSAAARAPEMEAFLLAFRKDPDQAVAEYGKTVGVSSRRDFMVRLRGRVRNIEDESLLRLNIEGEEEILIEIRNGPVFGNSVRDSSGLFSVDSFTDTRKFNDISAELNRRVETLILPALFNQVREGSELELVGCFSLDSRTPEIGVIRFIPIRFEVLKL